ncbi:MAG TPA: protein kinase [Polyangiaceae bacterium]
MKPAQREFEGTERYLLEGRLGEGGMGIVHRARDIQTSQAVALKTMAYVEPSALLRFKKEFRALADISHPNLVELYDLVSEGEHWFFTMELVEGVDFLRWVRRAEDTPLELGSLLSWTDASSPSLTAATVEASSLPLATSGTSGVLVSRRSVSEPRMCDIERLRPALKQLAEAMVVLHAAGKLHRDLKPSNVLVTREGRVVVLDFGVVGDVVSSQGARRGEDQILGTPAYMAPEQARGALSTPAVDWYAFGVMLYEALTDQLPFDGAPVDILFNKQAAQPKAPRALLDSVPADLNALCLDLLNNDPKRRPRGEEVVHRLAHSEATHRTGDSLTTMERPFVGRRQQLEQLLGAFERSAQGQNVVVLVSGRSGMGKTALVQRFLGQAAGEKGALVLSGRCFEREAVPFKGMDNVVDELSHLLSHKTPAEMATLIPVGIHHLSRVFPVLRAAPGVENVPQPEHEIIEPIELRKRAFAALKELLAGLATVGPLIVHIDDIQWSDLDSLLLLEEILSPPGAPALLLVCGFREEMRNSSPILRELLAMLVRLGRATRVEEISVDQLSPDEAIELATRSLGTEGARSPDLARAIAIEAQGMPIFVSELAEWQRQRAPNESGATEQLGVSLEQVIQRRVAELPESAVRLLEALAIANGPIPYEVAELAAETPRDDQTRTRLRAVRLTRHFRAEGREFVETYHARVRDSVVQALTAERRALWHGRIAAALEQSGRPDPEALVEHYLAAGDPERARGHVLAAAEGAHRALAFVRAARLYRRALDLGVERPRHELLSRVGDSWVHAGRSAEAASAYLSAAETAPEADAVELRRLAAEHFLKSGREDEGLAVLRSVLRSVGLRYPESDALAVASLLFNQLRLATRSLEFTKKSAGNCERRELSRVDVAFSATAGLAMVDVVRGAGFGARHLLLALEVGEPIRICRALALEAGNAAAVGRGSRERTERMVRIAEALAAQSEDPHGTALAKVAAGLVRVFSGEWRSALQTLDEAERILRERCRAVTWELTNTQAWSCNSLILCGDLRAASDRVPAIVREASERSDRFAQMHMIYPACITALAAGDADTGWRVASDDSSFRTSGAGLFTGGHWSALISAVSVHRYRGEGRAALRVMRERWPALESSQFLRVHLMRVFSEFERGLSLIAAIDDGDSDPAVVAAAKAAAKRLLRDSPEYAHPMGDLLTGCLAAARGDREQAEAALARASDGLTRVDMGYLAACARLRQAWLLGGDGGRELRQATEADLARKGVVDSHACLNMSAPGFRRLGA